MTNANRLRDRRSILEQKGEGGMKIRLEISDRPIDEVEDRMIIITVRLGGHSNAFRSPPMPLLNTADNFYVPLHLPFIGRHGHHDHQHLPDLDRVDAGDHDARAGLDRLLVLDRDLGGRPGIGCTSGGIRFKKRGDLFDQEFIVEVEIRGAAVAARGVGTAP